MSGPTPSAESDARRNLVALSRWIDSGNAHRDPEAVTWGRLSKITEEAGEAIAAFIGYTGQNPRKGRTHGLGDVIEELLDVAVTALGAVEHMTGHEGLALLALLDKINAVAERAGVCVIPPEVTAVEDGCTCGGMAVWPQCQERNTCVIPSEEGAS